MLFCLSCDGRSRHPPPPAIESSHGANQVSPLQFGSLHYRYRLRPRPTQPPLAFARLDHSGNILGSGGSHGLERMAGDGTGCHDGAVRPSAFGHRVLSESLRPDFWDKRGLHWSGPFSHQGQAIGSFLGPGGGFALRFGLYTPKNSNPLLHFGWRHLRCTATNDGLGCRHRQARFWRFSSGGSFVLLADSPLPESGLGAPKRIPRRRLPDVARS